MNNQVADTHSHMFDQVKENRPQSGRSQLDSSQYVLDPKINSIVSEMRSTGSNSMHPIELTGLNDGANRSVPGHVPINETNPISQGRQPFKLDAEEMRRDIQEWTNKGRRVDVGVDGDKRVHGTSADSENESPDAEDQARIEARHQEYQRLLMKLDLPKAPLTDEQKKIAGELLYALKGGDDPYVVDKLSDVVKKYGDKPEDLKAAVEVLNKLDPSIKLEVGGDGRLTVGGGALTIYKDGSFEVRHMNDDIRNKPQTKC